MNWRLMMLALAAPLLVNACGHKGKLKTPAQVEAEAAKKAAKNNSTTRAE